MSILYDWTRVNMCFAARVFKSPSTCQSTCEGQAASKLQKSDRHNGFKCRPPEGSTPDN